MKASTLIRGAVHFAGAVLLLGVGVAQAAICIANSNFTNPDATLTNAIQCGEGSGNNDTAALVNQQEPSARLWSFLDRDGPTGQNADPPANPLTEAVFSVTSANSQTGNWFIDAPAGFDAFLIVIKDGDTIGTGGPQWFWFEVDTAAGCSIGGAPAGTDYCGSWTMYGTNGTTLKDASHLTAYGTTGGFIRPAQIPEPGSLALFGSALLGFLWLRRRVA